MIGTVALSISKTNGRMNLVTLVRVGGITVNSYCIEVEIHMSVYTLVTNLLCPLRRFNNISDTQLP